MVCSVANNPPRPLRARNIEEKLRRRDEILKSAESLWNTTSYAELSMNQVAREAKLAKGTLYLYFDTKEELFLALLGEHLRDWFKVFLQQLQEFSPQTPEQVADIVVETTRDRVALRRLLVLLGTVLERNIQPESAHNFRNQLRQDVTSVVSLLPFAPTTTVRMLMHVYALSVGWHQATEARAATDISLPNEFQRPSFETEFAVSLRASLVAVINS